MKKKQEKLNKLKNLIILEQDETTRLLFNREILKLEKEILDSKFKDVTETFNHEIKTISLTKGDKGEKGDSVKGDKGDSIKGDKGDKGDTVKGDKGDSIKGDKGDDYIITESDLQDIAELVKIETPDVIEKTPEEIRDLLETLKEDDRLDVSAIKGIEKLIKKLSKSGNTVYVGGGRSQVVKGATVPAIGFQIGTPLYLKPDGTYTDAKAITDMVAEAVAISGTEASLVDVSIAIIDYSTLLETGQAPITALDVGKELYLSETESGKYTRIKPTVSQQQLLVLSPTSARWRHSEAFDGAGGGGSVVEVIDNLTSTDIDKALSANQGRVLDETKADLVPLEVIKKLAFNTQEPANPSVGDSYISDPILEATNYDKWSERNIANYVWNYNDGVTFYEDYAPDPFGGNESAKISATSGNSGYHKARASNSIRAFDTFETITMSSYLKRDGCGGVALGGLRDAEQAKFDLIIGAEISRGAAVSDAGIVDIGNGWFRVWTTFRFLNVVGNQYLYGGMSLLDNSLSVNFTGADDGLLVFGFMVSIGGITPYVATNGSVVTQTLPLTGTITTTQTFTANYIYTWNGTIWEEYIANEGLTVFVTSEDTSYVLTSLGWVKNSPWETLPNKTDIKYNTGKVGIATNPDDLFHIGGTLKIAPQGSSGYMRIYIQSNQMNIQTSYNGLTFKCKNTGGYYFYPHSTAGTGLSVYQNGEYTLFVGGNNNQQGRVGIGTNTPQSKLDVQGGIKVGDDTDVASADKVGTTRYRADSNNSYLEICMQTGASTYAWQIIKTNTW